MSHRFACYSGVLAILVGCALTLTLQRAAFAQETTAGIEGTVKDAQGGVVPDAKVEVSGPGLIAPRSTTADSAGKYRITGLPPGVYTLTVSAPSFRTTKRTGLELFAGRLPTIDVQLEVGSVNQVVEVTAAAPIVDVTQSKVAVTVDQQALEAVPHGRSFESVIPFAPGARQEPLQGATTTRGRGFQIDGASDSENVYLIDGVDTTDIQNGGVGKSFQMDFIQEVQIKSSSFEAEHGGALGGVINAVPKHGTNAWHGEVKSYFQTNALNATDPCASGLTSSGNNNFTVTGWTADATTCGLRLDPTKAPATGRIDGTPEYYVAKKDDRLIIEPGFELGGPLLKNRLAFFTSYIPTLDTTYRTTTFTGANPGARELKRTFKQHNMYNRLDYRVYSKLNVFGAWNYAFAKTEGLLGYPDSAYGQRNTGASTNPNTLNPKFGTVSPLATYTFGGDWTPNSKAVVAFKYGYFFSNNEDRGRPSGIRYVYNTTVNASSRDLAGNPFPASSFNTSGFSNIPSNLTTQFDAYKRRTINADASYFVSRLLGTHTFKGGYARMHQSNDVLRTFNTSLVTLFWSRTYSPLTSTAACDSVKAQNVANGLPGVCQGLYGYFDVGHGVTNTGSDSTYSNALYIQDAWNVGFIRGLTLNLGLRFDQESLPPYNPTRFPEVRFGWGDKIAPRIGGAYDLLHNGKVKVYASYGKFFDIMKMGLARGSFGSDYWHNCVYAMDNADFNTIQPSLTSLGGCPASGPAPGVTVGRFIENVDFRATKVDPRDPAISPTMKPMEQHEFVTGVDWAITPNWSLESRYSRKRLDRTIEDMAITDNLGFYIGNPGTLFADVLHRPVLLDPTVGLVGPFCAECPPVVPAIRRYDGVEFRLARRPGAGKWFGAISYAFSSLTGNYSGLTDTDPNDGNGGRHAPNNHRAFDIPTMTYLPNGKIDDGPLPTDRPNTAKIQAYYRLKWLTHETTFGVIQSALQGTPVSTCLAVVGTGSSCQYAEGRGNFVQWHRLANGDFVQDRVSRDARLDPFFQTDLTVRQEFRLTERYRMAVEADIFNVFNQRAPLAMFEGTFIDPNADVIQPSRASRFPGDPKIDWTKLMTGYNYTSEINAEGLGLASRYGLPKLFQGARNMRLTIRFVF